MKSSASKRTLDNRANQLNPGHPTYHLSRVLRQPKLRYWLNRANLCSTIAPGNSTRTILSITGLGRAVIQLRPFPPQSNARNPTVT